MTTVSETLNTAADLIEERGWTTGNDGMLVASDSPLCIEGALAAAAGIDVYATHIEWPELSIFDYGAIQACPAYAAIRSYLAERHSGRYVWQWNDHIAKSDAEVIEVLRAAAVIEAARENENAAVEVAA